MSKNRVKPNCYCAFCKTPRKVYRSKHLAPVGYLGCAVGSLILMAMIFGTFDARVFVIMAMIWGFSEAFLKVRWRMSIVCKICGFDPVLYVKTPEQAAEKVRLQLDARKLNPNLLLAKSLNLPGVPAQRAAALKDKSKGKIVSRSI